MGSNSFLVFNPDKANQETDEQYLVNSTRLNGAVTGLFPSILANKIFYQASIMAAAWGEVFKGLGFTVADTDFNALVTILTTILTKAGGNLTGAINETYATLASDAAVNIGAANANFIVITGNTTITAFDTIQEGTRRILYFAGALTLTHHATKLILPGSANITTQAKACAEFVSLGGGNWVCTNYSADIFELTLDGNTLTMSGSGLKVTDDIFAFLAGEDAQPFSAANGASGKQVTNISQFTASKLANGYQKLASGLILQWGKVIKPGGGWIKIPGAYKTFSFTVTFPIPFPTAIFNVHPTVENDNSSPGVYETEIHAQVGALTKTTALIIGQWVSGGEVMPTAMSWFAIGY